MVDQTIVYEARRRRADPPGTRYTLECSSSPPIRSPKVPRRRLPRGPATPQSIFWPFDQSTGAPVVMLANGLAYRLKRAPRLTISASAGCRIYEVFVRPVVPRE